MTRATPARVEGFGGGYWRVVTILGDTHFLTPSQVDPTLRRDGASGVLEYRNISKTAGLHYLLPSHEFPEVNK